MSILSYFLDIGGDIARIAAKTNLKLCIGLAPKRGQPFAVWEKRLPFRQFYLPKAYITALGKHLPVMDTVIPATVRLAEVSTADKSIFQHEPRGRAAEAYRSLTKEVLEIGHKERSRASDLSR